MRGLSTAFVDEVSGPNFRPALFIRVDFVSGPVYVWQGVGPIVWNGHTFTGIGSLGSVSTIEEGATIEAKGITLSLSGVDVAWLSDILLEFQQGLPAIVWLGAFDTNQELVPDPVIAWSGRTDQPTIEMDGQTATISITCESRLVEMNVAVDRRYTNEDQQLDYPGDRGFEFVNSIQDARIFWGSSPSSKNNL